MINLKSFLLTATLFTPLCAGAVFAEAPATPDGITEVVVEGQLKAHQAGDATEAGKSGVPDKENPQATSVVTADTLKAQGVTRLADALRNVAGMSRSSTYGFFDAWQIRGYDAAYGSVFLDGLKKGNVAGEIHELGGLEQVEVIKGPASGLYGASPLGGVVNLVSKRPHKGNFTEVTVGAGSYDSVNLGLDINHALNKEETILGRLNLVYRDGDQFVDFSHLTRLYVAPAMTVQLSEKTRFTLLARYQRDDTNPFSPLPAYGTILPNPNGQVPVTFAVSDPTGYYDQESAHIGYELIHRFSEHLSFEQNLRYERAVDDWDRWMFAAGVSDDQTTIGRYLYGRTHYDNKTLGVDSRFKLDFATGSITHRMMVGYDYYNNHYDYYNGGLYDGSLNPLNLFEPDYNAPLDETYDDFSAGGARSWQAGFYVQDNIGLTSRLNVSLGGRWDKVNSEGARDSAFSPTVGATYAVTGEASLYANVAKSFTPTPAWNTTFDGSQLPPETGENLEVGLKYVGKTHDRSALISVFQLTRKNVATDDPAHPFYYVVTGEQQSRGVELEGAWQPADGWDLRAAYAYIDAKITKDNTYPVGIPLPNAPKHALNLWGQYTVQDGPLAQLGLSAGLNYNSERSFYEYGVGLFTLKPYTLFDLGLSYPVARWTARFNVSNLFDVRYFPDACCLDRVTPGAPRSWSLSLSRRY